MRHSTEHLGLPAPGRAITILTVCSAVGKWQRTSSLPILRLLGIEAQSTAECFSSPLPCSCHHVVLLGLLINWASHVAILQGALPSQLPLLLCIWDTKGKRKIRATAWLATIRLQKLRFDIKKHSRINSKGHELSISHGGTLRRPDELCPIACKVHQGLKVMYFDSQQLVDNTTLRRSVDETQLGQRKRRDCVSICTRLLHGPQGCALCRARGFILLPFLLLQRLLMRAPMGLGKCLHQSSTIIWC